MFYNCFLYWTFLNLICIKFLMIQFLLANNVDSYCNYTNKEMINWQPNLKTSLIFSNELFVDIECEQNGPFGSEISFDNVTLTHGTDCFSQMRVSYHPYDESPIILYYSYKISIKVSLEYLKTNIIYCIQKIDDVFICKYQLDMRKQNKAMDEAVLKNTPKCGQ